MLNVRWLFGLALVASITPACTTNTSLGREGEDADRPGADAGRDTRPATGCSYAPVSVDLGCNDDPSLPTVAGSCEFDGTCTCRPGFVLNPTSKRCKLDLTSDAGAVICTVGADQSCNDDTWASWIAGTCVGGVACACKTGYLLNVATGRCKRAPVTDAGSDTAVGQVCTFLLDQTCNDDDLFSGTAGVCMKGFTCSCNSGFVLNPATGRCRAGLAPDAAAITPDAPVSNDTGASKDTGSVVVDSPVGKDSSGVCTFGMNQTCNDSPFASWVAGTCQSDGTCVCDIGYVMNPSSGRCAYAPRDAGPDLPSDAKTVCTPGSDQTCNDSPASALWGTCQANGTCSCINGSIINSNTGKCMRPEVSTCSGSYDACICGCCGTPPAVCYYPSAGDSLSTIKAADEATKNSTNCNLVGCALGQRYLCCAETAAEPGDSTQYSASYNIGGYDRIGLKKTGTDGNCMVLTLIKPVPTGTSNKPLRVSVPSSWGIEGSITVSACRTSGSSEQSIGAQGTVTFSQNGTSCAINAHMTVFFYAADSGTVSTRRIDADNVPITGGAPSGLCK